MSLFRCFNEFDEMMEYDPSKRTSGNPPYDRLKSYLDDYRADRNIVFLSVHKAAVDRIYHQDKRIWGWKAYWHDGTATPYLERAGELMFPQNTIPGVQARIRSDHQGRAKSCYKQPAEAVERSTAER